MKKKTRSIPKVKPISGRYFCYLVAQLGSFKIIFALNSIMRKNSSRLWSCEHQLVFWFSVPSFALFQFRPIWIKGLHFGCTFFKLVLTCITQIWSAQSDFIPFHLAPACTRLTYFYLVLLIHSVGEFRHLVDDAPTERGERSGKRERLRRRGSPGPALDLGLQFGLQFGIVGRRRRCRFLRSAGGFWGRRARVLNEHLPHSDAMKTGAKEVPTIHKASTGTYVLDYGISFVEMPY